MRKRSGSGFVYIIGAGPGDPGLVTLKAVECLKSADAVLYDRLANPCLLDFARPGAELIFAGKGPSRHSMTQEEINDALAKLAKSGLVVARLKGGDPYVFGRGGEEALHLQALGIPFEIVPGISAFSAVPAYAGIPVTHRGMNSTAAIVTGHEDPSKEDSDVDYSRLAGIGTIVFFMGVKNLPFITKKLIEHGKSPDTPAAVIERGTTPLQRTISATLSTICERVSAEGIEPPAIFIAGENVSLRSRLNWYENLPLFGRRIVVTRTREQSSEMAGKLSRLGAEVLKLHSIRIIDPYDGFASLFVAFSDFEKYRAVVFTSVNGVSRFFRKLSDRGMDARDLAGKVVAAIGSKTAAELENYQIKADLVPSEFRGEALARKIAARFGDRKVDILLARAQEAGEAVPDELKAAGHRIHDVAVYKTIKETNHSPEVLESIRSGKIDMLTFASSQTVENFVDIVGGDHVAKWAGSVKCAAIGPVTAKTCRKHGFSVDVTPSEYTIDALVDGITEYYRP